METVPKDVIELITNKLSPNEFLNYCKSEVGKKFCKNKDIWSRRIQKDFGVLLQGRNNDKVLLERKSDPKKAYLELFTKTSQAAEQLIEEIYRVLGKFSKFLKKKYKLQLYSVFFEFLLNMVNEIDTSDAESSASDYIGENQNKLMGKYSDLLPDIFYENENLYDSLLEDLGAIIERYALDIFNPDEAEIRGRSRNRSPRSVSASPQRSRSRSP